MGLLKIIYVANIVETVDGNGSAIVDYQFEQNVYSDTHFLGDHLEQLQYQEVPTVIVMDGAYTGQAYQDAAATKNVTLINTSLMGDTGS